MVMLDTSLEDQLLRLLDGAPRGLTVERLRSHLMAAGAQARKDDIVRALRSLSERGHVQIGTSRKWRIRRNDPFGSSSSIAGTDVLGGQALEAIPCLANIGESSDPLDAVPDGKIAPNHALLKRLLPYYQEALRAGDGGSPVEFIPRYGESFVLLQPDGPWWPTASHGRVLRVPLSRLPEAFRPLLAKNVGRKLLLGYPVHVINPSGAERQAFLRPVTTFRCQYLVTQTHLEIRIPSMPPAIVQDWLRDQKKYGGWDVARLKSWLLLEDEQAGLEDDDDVAAPDFVEIPTFASRLAIAAGNNVQQRLTPDAIPATVTGDPKTGYYNAITLMVDGGSRYTRSAIGDYDVLQAQGEERFTGTALDVFFGGAGQVAPPPPVVHPFPMGESQLLAARTALKGPLTVITGPPGTGKSQVIAAIMLSAAAAGKSVLFAARQHRALDAVQERLHDLTGDRVLLIRANEPEGFGGFRFSDALKSLKTRVGDVESARLFGGRYDRIADLDRRRWALLEKWQSLRLETIRSAELLAKVEAAERKLQELEVSQAGVLSAAPSSGFWSRLSRWFISKIWGRPGPIAFGQSWARAQGAKELASLRDELEAVELHINELRKTLEGATETPIEVSQQLADEAAKLVEPLLDNLDTVTKEARQALTDLAGDSSLMGSGTLSAPARNLILKHFPLWAVTTLAAGSRIPAEAGMFDYVIFDEAAQTDIASAVPLLYRARAAVIVGDPMQLAMISNLDPREERDLLQRHELLREGIGRYAQGRTTLFDLASAYAGDARFMLTEHYRCHPEIAAYFNEAFYGRRLAALTDVSRLRVPRGFRSGLHWTSVSGPVVSRTGGATGSASSEAEAKAIVEHLRVLIEQGFEGNIGVVTFFDFQARTINEMAARQIGAAELNKHAVKVFTANKFQGDERDVMLLSLCLGPTMPAGARSFIQKERRLLNVAVSRARAVCHVFGDLDFASSCGIPHVELLTRKLSQAGTRIEGNGDDRFDSPWERRLYDALVKRGLSPIAQHPVGGRFLDLALVDETRSPPVQIDIEVDGVTFHTDVDGNRLATDLWRDHQLRGLGWKVLRFWVYELRDDMETCLERIEAEFRA